MFRLSFRSTLSLAVAAFLVLSLFVSAPATGGILMPPWDKLAHLGFFACITLLLAIGFGRRYIFLAFIAAVATGIADESYQAFLPTRHANWGDLLTDIIAAACAALLARHFFSTASPELPVTGIHDPDAQQQVGQGMGKNRRP